jgi:type II secretory pathway pseudopilin PulG
VVVITIIAILTAMILPIINYVGRARVTVTKDSLGSLAKALKRFHEDTGVWPSGNGTWVGATGTQKGPSTFAASDTAMHALPSAATPALSLCLATNGPLATPCWGGPYLNLGTSLGDPQVFDVWGNALQYVYVPPGASAPNGVIVVWSSGPDGVNQSTDVATLSRGQPAAGSDDIVQVVGSAL